MSGQHHQHVLFQFRTPARRVYLMARSAAGLGCSVNLMTPSRSDDGLWELLLPLPSGRHHVRYYVDDGRRTVYFEPQEPQAGMEGLDLIVNVPEQPDPRTLRPPGTPRARNPAQPLPRGGRRDARTPVGHAALTKGVAPQAQVRRGSLVVQRP
jgi:hypothetical protein